MATISVKSDLDQLAKRLPRYFKKQIPFVTAGALTATAAQARKDVIKAAPLFIDRPVLSFLRKNLLFKRANKANLRSAVYFTREGWETYRYQVTGGRERPRRRATFYALSESELRGKPSRVSNMLKRDRYGNVRQGRLAKVIAHPNTFMGTHAGYYGLWERYNRGKRIRLLGVFSQSGYAYQRSLPYEDIVQGTVDDVFVSTWSRLMQREIRKGIR